MTPQEFVGLIKTQVHDAAIEDTTRLVAQPSGRSPSQSEVELARWYGQLSGRDRQHVNHVVKLSVQAAVFGFLSILDGVRSISTPKRRVSLELHSLEENGRTRLNGATDEMLHDLYQGQVYQEVFGTARSNGEL